VQNFREVHAMKRFKRLSHSIYECKYHIVFNPKYRYQIFKDDNIAEYTRQQIYQLCKQKELLEVLELNVRYDHIHIVMSIPPKYSVSNVVGYLKGKLAFGVSGSSDPEIRLFERCEQLGRRYWGRHLW
jgi:putative transposase